MPSSKIQTQHRRIKVHRTLISVSPVFSGLLLCLVSTSSVGLVLMKELYNTRRISVLLLDYLVDLHRSQPSNPLAILLYMNRNLLLKSVQTSHYNAVKWFSVILAITSLIMLAAAVCGTVAHFSYKRNFKEHQKTYTAHREKGKSIHLTSFMLGFFVGVTLLSTLFLIPFLIIQKRNLGKIISFAFSKYKFNGNPLAEVTKRIIEETFKNDTIVESVANKIYTSLLITAVVSIVIVLGLSALLFFFHLGEKDESKKQGEQTVEITPVNAEPDESKNSSVAPSLA